MARPLIHCHKLCLHR